MSTLLFAAQTQHVISTIRTTNEEDGDFGLDAS